jgi:hypothetical protein
MATSLPVETPPDVGPAAGAVVPAKPKRAERTTAISRVTVEFSGPQLMELDPLTIRCLFENAFVTGKKDDKRAVRIDFLCYAWNEERTKFHITLVYDSRVKTLTLTAYISFLVKTIISQGDVTLVSELQENGSYLVSIKGTCLVSLCTVQYVEPGHHCNRASYFEPCSRKMNASLRKFKETPLHELTSSIIIGSKTDSEKSFSVTGQGNFFFPFFYMLVSEAEYDQASL